MTQKKRGEASPVGGCSYSFHKEMGHFCKRLLYVRTYGNPVGFFLLVKSKSRTDKCW